MWKRQPCAKTAFTHKETLPLLASFGVCVNPRATVRLEKLSLKIPIDSITNRTRALLAFNTVSQLKASECVRSSLKLLMKKQSYLEW